MSSDKQKAAIVPRHALTGMPSASPTGCCPQFSAEQKVLHIKPPSCEQVGGRIQICVSASDLFCYLAVQSQDKEKGPLARRTALGSSGQGQIKISEGLRAC